MKYFLLFVAIINSAFAIYGETGDEKVAKALSSGVVQLIKNRGGKLVHSCSGSIVKPHIVLTAAHCFEDKNYNFTVLYKNKNYRPTRVQVASHYIKEDLIDPYWDYVYDIRVENDLALVFVATPFPSRDVVTLQPQLSGMDLNSTVVFSGYGQTANIFGMGKGEGTYRISGFTHPANIFPYRLHVRDGATGACQGDSGGPVWLFQDGRYTQIGITSQGDCSTFSWVERVSFYRLLKTKFTTLWPLY